MNNFHPYWEKYDPRQDYNSLAPSVSTEQNATGASFQLQKAGWDPIWIYEKFGSVLGKLPAHLYDAVFNAMRSGELLSNNWGIEAQLFIDIENFSE
ncbi:MAG: hypothetical protein HC907_36700 [Richelia sp. SM1_7_0]|nr:hypothetical protein [Richelia sp. SM1_7_0]